MNHKNGMYRNLCKGTASGLMWLLGFFIGGAANIIGAACSADLGKAAIEMGMESAVSIVAGIIDGTGSVGAAVGQGMFDHQNDPI